VVVRTPIGSDRLVGEDVAEGSRVCVAVGRREPGTSARMPKSTTQVGHMAQKGCLPTNLPFDFR
jgi:hypothetical protein